MAYSKKVYITKVIFRNITTGDETRPTQVPYFGAVDDITKEEDPNDPFWWEPCYDEDVPPQDGIHTTCVIGVYCNDADHAILEADPDIALVE